MYTQLYGLPTVTFRYSNVYGERQPLKVSTPVVGIFLRQRAAGQALTIVGDGNQRRDFTYVGDVVEQTFLQQPLKLTLKHLVRSIMLELETTVQSIKLLV